MTIDEAGKQSSSMSDGPSNPFAPPSRASDSAGTPTTERSPHELRRLLLVQGAIAVTISLLIGIVTMVQFSSGLAKFGGLEYAPRVLVLSATRVLGTAASTSAAIFALIVCTHAVDPSTVRPYLRRMAPWSVGLVVTSSPVTTVVAITAGFLVSHGVYAVPWASILTSRAVLAPGDLTAAGWVLVQDSALAAGFCWFALPAMNRRSWSLLRKLGTTWIAFAIFGIASELVTR